MRSARNQTFSARNPVSEHRLKTGIPPQFVRQHGCGQRRGDDRHLVGQMVLLQRCRRKVRVLRIVYNQQDGFDVSNFSVHSDPDGLLGIEK
jgi:hypothetical protein